MKPSALILPVIFLLSTFAVAQEGEKLYLQYCSQCHGLDRKGGIGLNLTDDTWINVKPQKAALVDYLQKGSPAKGMPAWKGIITDNTIATIADYLLDSKTKNLSAPQTQTDIVDKYPELKNFRLPVGFSISVYSDQVESARSLAVSASGLVFVGSRQAGKVYAVVDSNKDYVADKVFTIAEGLDSPIGVTLLNGSLYVAEISRILRFDNIEKTYDKSPTYTVVKDGLPNNKWHGYKVIEAGPEGKLYFEIGSPCNTCDKEDDVYSKIYRMNPDGSNMEIVARGIRNTVGLSWHPVTKELWFTDNGPDEFGDNLPSCELNHLTKIGQHFGFPYCHGGVVLDPQFGKNKSCDNYVAPAANLGPHVAPLGLAFNTGKQFPEQYKNQLFVAEHGSWNRTQKSGYRVSLVTLVNNKVASDTVFIDGFLQKEEVVGRPVDIDFLPDGSMLISDDYRGRLYRVSYQ